jgi:hypothetical protein
LVFDLKRSLARTGYRGLGHDRVPSFDYEARFPDCERARNVPKPIFASFVRFLLWLELPDTS